MKRLRTLLCLLNGLLLLLPASAPAKALPATEAAPSGEATVLMAPDLTDPKRKAAALASAEAEALEKREAPLPERVRAVEKALALWQQTGDGEKILKTQIELIGLAYVRGELGLALKTADQALSSIEAGERDKANNRILLLILHQMTTQAQGNLNRTVITLSKVLEILENTASSEWQGVYNGGLVSLAQNQGSLGRYRDQAATIERAKKRFSQKGANTTLLNLLIHEAQHELTEGSVENATDLLLMAFELQQKDPGQRKENRTRLIAMSFLPFTCPPEGKRLNRVLANSPPPERSGPTELNEAKPSTIREWVLKARAEGAWGHEQIQLSIEAQQAQITGDYGLALQALGRRLEITRLMGARADEAETLTSLATIHRDQGQPQKALEALNQALAIQQQLHLRPRILHTLESIGDLYQSLGASDTALLYFQQARQEARNLGHHGDLQGILISIARLERKRHRFSEALATLEEAFRSSSTRSDCLSSFVTLFERTRTRLEAGRPDMARIDALRAMAMADDLQVDEHRLTGKAKALNLQAKILLKQNKAELALRQAKQALNLAKQTTYFPETSGPILGTIAESHAALGKTPEAIAAYREQRDLYTRLNRNPERAQNLYATAKLQRQQGERQTALDSINEAISVVESMREQMADPELRTSVFANYQDFYSFKIDLLLELEASQPGVGHAAEAFHTSERSRARTLLELLQDARADIRQGVDPALLEQEKALKYRRTALDKRWKQTLSEAGGSRQLPQLQQERQQLLQDAELLRQKMRTSSPRYAALTDPQPLTLSQVQKQLLDPDTLLLQYVLGPERSHLFVVSRDDLQVITLPAAAAIEALVHALRDPLTKNQNPEQIKASASQLSQAILQPAAARIALHKRLILVPDGALHLAPFAALPLGGEPLTNTQQLLHLPSSSTLALLRERPDGSTARPATSIAILADPIFSANDGRLQIIAGQSPRRSTAESRKGQPKSIADIAYQRTMESEMDCDNTPPYCRLKHTRDEASAIQSTFPAGRTRLALDTDANRQLATAAAMDQYAYLHVATHGIFNSNEPSLSGLLLSRVDRQGRATEGLLQLGDIFNLRLNSDLVVLSACETGRGTEIRGEGLVGMTRGFLYAGSQRVVASLWKVDDAATATFMQRFYSNLITEKQPPSQALRSTQLFMQSHKTWASPFYWSAFVLQGEW
jgi:CHAT domain-containing protein